ncbi:hypothetical protein HW130_04905 [Streptomyces sp. PKU-EA00015]|uniref:hypothetical protein n=1 Tax=Streptomyces sp. PKU-EA00015 TaxID=2748326 RepID=UPI0015A3858A|nr:hypothetical protein [Streptomyces sp. PKU-EA00015]NWF25608.1 hypothetical protein [Streptomyces sp. PKU-EA00015]
MHLSHFDAALPLARATAVTPLRIAMMDGVRSPSPAPPPHRYAGFRNVRVHGDHHEGDRHHRRPDCLDPTARSPPDTVRVPA